MGSDDTGTPVVRVGLQKLDPVRLVLEDPVLSRSALVRALDDAASEVLSHAEVRRVPVGGRLVGVGEEADRVFLVLKGRVTLLTGVGSEAVAAAELSPGDLCCAAAALEGRLGEETAVAAEAVDVAILDAGRLRRLAGERPAVAEVLASARDREAGAAEDLAAFLDRW